MDYSNVNETYSTVNTVEDLQAEFTRRMEPHTELMRLSTSQSNHVHKLQFDAADIRQQLTVLESDKPMGDEVMEWSKRKRELSDTLATFNTLISEAQGHLDQTTAELRRIKWSIYQAVKNEIAVYKMQLSQQHTAEVHRRERELMEFQNNPPRHGWIVGDLLAQTNWV